MHRRAFFSTAIGIVQGAIGLTLAIPGLGVLLAPLFRRRTSRPFIRVAPLSAVPDKEPLLVVVNADRWDAYTHHPPGPIGRVWLLRDSLRPDDGAVVCFQTICPHLGCGIDFASDREVFTCPCHDSEFDVDGRVRLGPAPRGMDRLACRVTEPDQRGRRWVEVRFATFQTGVPEPRPVS